MTRWYVWFSRWLGSLLGYLWFDIFRIRRKVALENLRRAFPDWTEKQRQQVARKSIFGLGQTLFEYFLFPFLSKRNIHHHFVLDTDESLQAALKKGKGALVLTLHLGNGDLAAAGYSLSGRVPRLVMISKEFRTRWLNRLWFGLRERLGTRFISPEKSSFEILRALKRNEVVVFVLDQFMGPPIGVRTRFFGHETGTAMGLALMAARTGVPVIPGYTYRRPDGVTVLVYGPEIPYLDDRPRPESISVMTQVYTDKLEEIVRRYPEQWMWIHRRWKEFHD